MARQIETGTDKERERETEIQRERERERESERERERDGEGGRRVQKLERHELAAAAASPATFCVK